MQTDTFLSHVQVHSERSQRNKQAVGSTVLPRCSRGWWDSCTKPAAFPSPKRLKRKEMFLFKGVKHLGCVRDKWKPDA